MNPFGSTNRYQVFASNTPASHCDPFTAVFSRVTSVITTYEPQDSGGGGGYGLGGSGGLGGGRAGGLGDTERIGGRGGGVGGASGGGGGVGGIGADVTPTAAVLVVVHRRELHDAVHVIVYT